MYKIKAKVRGRKVCSNSDHGVGISTNEGSRENAK